MYVYLKIGRYNSLNTAQCYDKVDHSGKNGRFLTMSDGPFKIRNTDEELTQTESKYRRLQLE